MFSETNKREVLHILLFQRKGNSIPLMLRKLIFEAAGENKLNYVVAFFLY